MVSRSLLLGSYRSGSPSHRLIGRFIFLPKIHFFPWHHGTEHAATRPSGGDQVPGAGENGSVKIYKLDTNFLPLPRSRVQLSRSRDQSQPMSSSVSHASLSHRLQSHPSVTLPANFRRFADSDSGSDSDLISDLAEADLNNLTHHATNTRGECEIPQT